MKKVLIILGLVFLVGVLSQCNTQHENSMKDLDQNMLDLAMYHDNLGIYLRKNEGDYASWLLEGMDSTLHIIAAEFDTHRKLTFSFNRSYKKLLLPSIQKMRNALEQNDIPAAITSYRLLTKNCNSCHIDHDIDKDVKDLTDPSYDDYR